MKAYILRKDPSHLMDAEFDVTHLDFEGKMDFRVNMITNWNVPLPEVIYCRGNFHLIPELDYPIVDIAEAVVSDRMLEILSKHNMPSYRSVKIVMLDDTYMQEPLSAEGVPKPEVRQYTNYQAIQLMEQPVEFDEEKSNYYEVPGRPGEIGFFFKLVLREPTNGFPAMFRLEKSSSTLFVSGDAKAALEEAGVSGCVFEDVEVHER